MPIITHCIKLFLFFQLVTDVACGNALVEAEEDCDCGTQQVKYKIQIEI